MPLYSMVLSWLAPRIGMGDQAAAVTDTDNTNVRFGGVTEENSSFHTWTTRCITCKNDGNQCQRVKNRRNFDGASRATSPSAPTNNPYWLRHPNLCAIWGGNIFPRLPVSCA